MEHMSEHAPSVGVLGAGTWGIALARLLCNTGKRVTVWSPIREEIHALETTHRHARLPDMTLPDGIRYTAELSEACAGQELVVFAVPSVYIRQTARKAAPFIAAGQIAVCVAKGIETDTLMTLTEVIEEELPAGVAVAALSGPTHAEEVAVDLPTAIVAAHRDTAVAETVQRFFTSPHMRVYLSTDVRGVEMCGALKNIIALAAGMCDGLGYGDNTKAALITRGLAELSRLGGCLGCFPQTFSGLTGMGDLIVTCTSRHSRNHQCGYLIGQGVPPKEAIRQVGMVVEGINALPAAMKLAERYQVTLPIIAAVNAVVHEGLTPADAVLALMNRTVKQEMPNKILPGFSPSREEGKLRNGTMKRVITYGTFDLLHYGHINILRRAKELGDYLIVALSTDEFNWNAKQKKCYFSYEQRKQLLEAIRYVDLVIPEESWEQKRQDMHEYHVDTFVMGDDWEGKFDFLREEGVEVVYLPRTPEISTTQIKRDLHEK